jgi:DNA-binding transcriptional LysR family regulator
MINNFDSGEDMDLTYFQTFRKVAECRSFTRAGEELGYAQSSVTAQIQKLEKLYEVKLFERYGRQLRLTPPGESLLKISSRMLELYEESKETIAGLAGGTLSIGTIDSLGSYFLPNVLQYIRRQFPELTIRLQTDRESAIVNKVKEGELDIGLLLDSNPVDPFVQCVAVKEEPLIVIAHPGHPLTLLDKVEIGDLGEAEWIMPEDSCNYRIMLEKVLKENQVPCRIGFELGNPEAVKRCVMFGSGIALLPRIVAEQEVSRGELAALSFTHPDIRLNLQMFIHPRKWMSKPLLACIEKVKSS